MAWAGFQVLSNRCVMWEREDGELHCVVRSLFCRKKVPVGIFEEVYIDIVDHIMWKFKLQKV